MLRAGSSRCSLPGHEVSDAVGQGNTPPDSLMRPVRVGDVLAGQENQQHRLLGVMFSARFGDEATLFGLAGQLEKAKAWAKRKPSI